MILYLDTSALVKLYIEEPQSADVRQIVKDARFVATSRIAYAEARAAFARKFREHGLTAKAYREILQYLDQDWESYFVIDISDSLIKLAGQFAEKHALRGMDAIHLASGVTLHRARERTVTFSCFDDRLIRAACKEGLSKNEYS